MGNDDFDWLFDNQPLVIVRIPSKALGRAGEEARQWETCSGCGGAGRTGINGCPCDHCGGAGVEPR